MEMENGQYNTVLLLLRALSYICTSRAPLFCIDTFSRFDCIASDYFARARYLNLFSLSRMVSRILSSNRRPQMKLAAILETRNRFTINSRYLYEEKTKKRTNVCSWSSYKSERNAAAKLLLLHSALLAATKEAA